MATTIPRTPMETNIQRRRDSGAERRGAVPDPCGQSAVSHVPPVAHDTRCAGKHWRLSGTKEDAGDNELPEAPDQTSRRLCKRPDKQAETQKPARTKAIGHCSARKLAESVSPEERRKQKPHVRDRQAKLLTNQRIGDGERCTVDIVERSGDHKKCKSRNLHPPDAGRNPGVGHNKPSLRRSSILSDETGTVDPAQFYRGSPINGLDDVTGKEPSTCKATSQPESSLAASRKPSTRLEWRRDCAISASSQFSRRAAPPVLAIGGNRLHKSGSCSTTSISPISIGAGCSSSNLNDDHLSLQIARLRAPPAPA